MPKFEFSANRFSRDFRTTDKKIQNLLESDAQIFFFNRKSVGLQPCTPLLIVFNGLCFQIILQYVHAINGRTSGVLPSGVPTLKWAILTPLG